MKYYGLDTETDDPLLLEQGPSWIFKQGEILVTGIYDMESRKKTAIDGNGGAQVRKMLFSATTTLVGANIGYDVGWLCYELGILVKDVKCKLIDVAIAESLIDQHQAYSLDALAQKYLRERKGHEELATIVIGYGWKGDFRKHLKKLWYGETPDKKSYKPEIRNYVISDADQPCRIWEKQRVILEEQELFAAFEMNMRMVNITLGMKQRGVRIDYAKWQQSCAVCKTAYDELHADFVSKYSEVNFRSGMQMAELFDEQGVPYKYKIVFKGWSPIERKFTKADWFDGDTVWDQRKSLKESFPNVRVMKGKIVLMIPKQYADRTVTQARNMGYEVSCNPSINKFTFAATKATHQVVADVVELKQVSNIIDKFLGPNFERFLVQDSKGNWRIHGNFDTVGARQTGRLSASKPNLQNIPSKTRLFAGTDKELDLAKMCREVFLPEPGEMLVKLDFSGQENVLQAHFAVGESGKRIRHMYTENPRLDEHQFVADVSGLQEEHGEKVGRKYAKNVRFGLSYGMQIVTMCEQFGWDKEFAEGLIEAVKDAAPWVHETMNYIQDMLLGKGKFYGQPRRYIKTIIGRRIHLQAGRDRDAYKFYNYLIQGSAADMMKLALVKFAGSTLPDTVTLLLTVHDEGCFSVPIMPEGFAAVLLLQSFFCSAVTLSIPINADPEAGLNWADVDGQKKDSDTKLFVETPLAMLERVGQDILSGKVEIVDKTDNTCNDTEDDIDFDELGEEDDDDDDMGEK